MILAQKPVFNKSILLSVHNHKTFPKIKQFKLLVNENMFGNFIGPFEVNSKLIPLQHSEQNVQAQDTATENVLQQQP